MRVLFWSELFLPYIGGAEVFAARLLPALAARGHEFVVITSHYNFDLPDEDELRGIPVHRLPFRRAIAAADPRLVSAARRRATNLLRDFAPDVVHINIVGPSVMFCLQCVEKTNTPLFVTLQHEVLSSQAGHEDSILARALQRADWVSTVSEAVLDQARNLKPAIRDKSSVIYSFAEVPADPPPPLPLDPPVLLCLGRLVPQKGFDLALKALPEIRKRIPAVHLVVAGDGADGKQLRRLASDLGIEESVEFTGWIEPQKVPELIRAATMVLMPSREEGLPMVSAEAAMLGRPLVTTPAGGVVELVHDRETGMIVGKEDSAALAKAVVDLLEHPEEAEALGLRARRRTVELFGAERCLDGYDSVYKRLAGKKA